MTGYEILQNSGAVSHNEALKKAKQEYEKYKKKTENQLTKAEEHFLNQIENTNKKLGNKKK